jgi:hypothetical protein
MSEFMNVSKKDPEGRGLYRIYKWSLDSITYSQLFSQSQYRFGQNAYNNRFIWNNERGSWWGRHLCTKYGRLSELGTNEAARTTKLTSVDNELDFKVEAKKILDNVAKDLREAFEDLTAIVVVTAVAETDAQLTLATQSGKFDDPNIRTKITAMALTRMELEGDVYTLLPAKGNDPEIRAEIIKEHKQNIALATENWRKFIDGVLTIVEIGADMADISLPNVRSRMMQIHGPPP